MAGSKKYAGLPDLDPAPEIYETPELTDEVSTIQTSTLRSDSPIPSDGGRHDPEAGLDQQRIDRNEARRRFDRAVVDARDVDFSDRVGADRKSYRISTRRRRYKDTTPDGLDRDSDHDEETLPRRLARLRREAEEVRVELERRGEQTEGPADTQFGGLEDEFSSLSLALDELRTPKSVQNGSIAIRALSKQPPARIETRPPTQEKSEEQGGKREVSMPGTSPSTIAAIASFSDRISALEGAFGISTSLPTAETGSVLPTLTSLAAQIGTLSSTLAPARSPNNEAFSTSPLPTLDELSIRVRALVSETDKLTLARKAALQSLQDLQEARLRNSESAPYGHHRHSSSQNKVLAEQAIAQTRQESQLFLDEQSSKIDALYQILPTIESLHPLLPTVLDRLRSLNIIHAGAADAAADLEEVERRQAKIDDEIGKWKEGLEMIEKGMREHERVSAGNIDVVQQMVEGLEQRLAQLGNGQV